MKYNIFLILTAFPVLATAAPAPKIVLAIHGGCGVISKSEMSKDLRRRIVADLRRALLAGREALRTKSSLDSVVAAVKVMEDSPFFNAGKGAAFNRRGFNELDAAVMDGKTRKAGAIAGVTIVKNPVEGARLVMEKSGHVMLSGDGAERFLAIQGAKLMDEEYFWTKNRLDQIHQIRDRNFKDEVSAKNDRFRPYFPDHKFGTVGAVALDKKGNLAAATSTGGLAGKRAGRVGDSPIIGAGTYADNKTVAVSATGDGEYFIRLAVAKEISAQVQYAGRSVEEASRDVIFNHLKELEENGVKVEGAVIALDAHGNLSMPYNTEGMYRGFVTENGDVQVSIYERPE